MAQLDKHQFKKIDQQLFTDSFNFCWELLKSKKYYLCERETNIFSRLSLNYGQDMYDAMMIIMNKIIKSNEHKVVVEKSKVGSKKIVTTEATRDSGYNNNYNQLNQQQQQQQVDKVSSQDKMISKKKKISVGEVHSKKMFKADNKKNSCDDSSNAKNIQITPSNGNKDEMLSVTEDSIDVNERHNSDNQSIGLTIKSNNISNSFNNNNQSYSNEVIENVDYQKNIRIRTGSLVDDDELSSTADKYDLDDNDIDVVDDDDDDVDDNSLNQNKSLKDEVKVYDSISFEEKTRVVKLAIENPNWSLDLLREQSGCENIKDRRQVEVWKNHIEQGGSRREKMNFVNNWVLNKCIENQKKGEVITNKKIRTWGLEAKKNCKPIKFTASDGWLSKFKKKHEITGEPTNLKINCNLQKNKS
ncbi:DNA ligase 1-like [Aphidius gifuensis]|uniref:DNA ligase 1-like n=1 Tax=Aphidius gifuensis TaxID=684658 RepID=UPI001CDD205C|nr:DNA ligase 1-like [Aphidius gifuensis]